MNFSNQEKIILRGLSKMEALDANWFKESMSVNECKKAASHLEALGFIKFVKALFEDTDNFFFYRTKRCEDYLENNPMIN